jgi:hypothetical protein
MKGNTMNDPKTPITLQLTMEEMTTVMQALGQVPYATVFQLVQKIQDQVVPQIEAKDTKKN